MLTPFSSIARRIASMLTGNSPDWTATPMSIMFATGLGPTSAFAAATESKTAPTTDSVSAVTRSRSSWALAPASSGEVTWPRLACRAGKRTRSLRRVSHSGRCHAPPRADRMLRGHRPDRCRGGSIPPSRGRLRLSGRSRPDPPFGKVQSGHAHDGPRPRRRRRLLDLAVVKVKDVVRIEVLVCLDGHKGWTVAFHAAVVAVAAVLIDLGFASERGVHCAAVRGICVEFVSGP